MDLADARRRKTQPPRDVAARHALEVVHLEHLPLDGVEGLLDLRDEFLPRRLLKRGLQRVVRELVHRIARIRVLANLHRDVVLLALLGVVALQVRQRHTERLRQLRIAGLALELGTELKHRGLALALPTTVEPRQEVHVAQLVEHRAANADLGERRELVALLRVVALDRLHQARDASVHEVMEIDARRQARREPTRHRVDGRMQLFDELIAQARVLATAIATQHVLYVDRLRRNCGSTRSNGIAAGARVRVDRRGNALGVLAERLRIVSTQCMFDADHRNSGGP